MRIVLDIGSDGSVYLWKDELLGTSTSQAFLCAIKAKKVDNVSDLIEKIREEIERGNVSMPCMFCNNE